MRGSPTSILALPLHQHLTIAIDRKVEAPGFGPWSAKDGVGHVQPPTSVLEQTLRTPIRFPAADASYGTLRSAPTSHRRGKLSSAEALGLRDGLGEVSWEVLADGPLVMFPQLLHGSSTSTRPLSRQVTHIEPSSGLIADRIEVAAP